MPTDLTSTCKLSILPPSLEAVLPRTAWSETQVEKRAESVFVSCGECAVYSMKTWEKDAKKGRLLPADGETYCGGRGGQGVGGPTRRKKRAL